MKPQVLRPRRSAPITMLLSAIAGGGLLTGCAGFQTTAPSADLTTVHIEGKIFGGQQPVSGAHVYMYNTGIYGYGSPSTSILGTGTTQAGLATDGSGNSYTVSDSQGNFTITGNYSCALGGPDSQVYLVAQGGNPGLGGNVNNTAIEMMAPLGRCYDLSSASFVQINEVTTAAGITALQQFTADSSHIGSSTANNVGIRNAFRNASNLVSVSSGSAQTTLASGSGTAPQKKLNTLGNILAPCVNSSSATSTACSSLFAAATPSGGTRPTTVFGAMLLIAKNPGFNVPALFGQTMAMAPFAPALTAAPNDLTLPMTFSGGGLVTTGDLLVDAQGNVYSGNCPTCIGNTGTDSIVGYSPIGTPITGLNGFSSGIHNLRGVSIDLSGNIWSANDASGSQPSTIVKMNNTGLILPGFPFTSAGLPAPYTIANDSAGAAWITDINTNQVFNLSSNGAQVGTYSAPNFIGPARIALDPNNFGYAAGETSGNFLKIDATNHTSSVLSSPTALTSPSIVSFDNSNNIWTLNDDATFSVIKSTDGTPITARKNIGGYQTAILIVDGLGTAWVGNCRGSCVGSGSTAPDNILHFNINGTSLLTSDGLQDSSLSDAGNMAIDPSGNLWVSNAISNTITQFPGVAGPVLTPLAAAAASNKFGVRP